MNDVDFGISGEDVHGTSKQEIIQHVLYYFALIKILKTLENSMMLKLI